jgi:hypothetical protein
LISKRGLGASVGGGYNCIDRYLFQEIERVRCPVGRSTNIICHDEGELEQRVKNNQRSATKATGRPAKTAGEPRQFRTRT